MCEVVYLVQEADRDMRMSLVECDDDYVNEDGHTAEAYIKRSDSAQLIQQSEASHKAAIARLIERVKSDAFNQYSNDRADNVLLLDDVLAAIKEEL
jgi:hypothetical protein